MTALWPSWFLADASVRPFAREQRVDVAASDAPTLNDEEFIVFENRTKRNEIEIVRRIVPYAMRRTDVGTPSEAFARIPPAEGDGYFGFSPKVGGKTALVLDTNLNAPRTAAGALNAERVRRGVITSLSDSPWEDAQAYNPLMAIAVPSEVVFQVTFSVLPAATASPIPNPFAVGGAGGARRVDFAGVVVTGVVMPQHLYDRVVEEIEDDRRR